MVQNVLIVVLFQLCLDLDVGVGVGLVKIYLSGVCGKDVLRHPDDDFDDFHLLAMLSLVEDYLTITDTTEVVFDFGTRFNDVVFGFFGDLAAVARADFRLYSLLLSVSLESSGQNTKSQQ